MIFFREYRDQVAAQIRELLAKSEIDSQVVRQELDREVTSMIKSAASKRAKARGSQKFADRGRKIKAIRNIVLGAKGRFCEVLDKSFLFPNKRMALAPAELSLESTVLDPRVIGVLLIFGFLIYKRQMMKWRF